MLKYFGRRLLEIIPLALVVSLVCFALMQATPGGPATMLSQNPMVKPEDLARIRSNFGIDQPVMVQYCMWLKRVVLHGDFGHSYVTGEPVLHMIGRRIPATLELMGSAFLLAFLFGISGGVLSALKRYTKLDSVLSVVAVVRKPGSEGRRRRPLQAGRRDQRHRKDIRQSRLSYPAI